MSWESDLQKITDQAAKTEAPAEMRAWVKRYRHLYVAMLQEGFSIQEIGNLTGIAIVILLNPEPQESS